MKNKPEKHKEKNLFKFKTFAERISEVDVRKSALYYIEHANEDQLEENECHFNQCTRKWTVLNLSKEYIEFQRAIKKIVTLPQLIHKEDFVVNHLLTSIERATNLSLQTLLEYVVALAKDLRDEFYKHFSVFLNKLILLLDTQDADRTEWVLVCLALLFKIQKPFLKKDITVVFKSIFPLLDENKPIHITNFATECFSFVARDIKDKKKFLSNVLKIIKNKQNGITGCGRLFFEIIRGVNGQFHSSAEENLNLYLEGLLNDELDHELLFQVLTQTVTDMLEYVSPKNIGIFWKVILNIMEGLDKKIENDKTNAEKSLEYLFRLMGQAIEHQNGIYVNDTNPIINIIIKISDLDIEEHLALIISQISAVLLLSTNLNVSHLDSTRLSRKILTTNHKIVFETFIWNVVKYSQFDIFIFPEFLKYFDTYFSESSLDLLVKIINYKSPLAVNGINLSNWKQIPIKLRTEKAIKQLENHILEHDVADLLGNSDLMLLALNCYPHIIGYDFSKVSEKIELLINEICNMISLEDEPLHGKEIEEFYQNKKLLFILSVLIEVQIHMNNKIDFNKILESILPYCADHKYLQVLRLVDLIVSNLCNDKLNATEELFNKLHKHISDNLSSPYSDVRLTTTHIFTYFSDIHGVKPANFEMSPYQIFFNVENINPTVHNFREHLRHLENFNCGSNYFADITNTKTKLDAMKYLMGVLYINFKPFWDPIINIITTYATEVSSSEFWEVFKKQMDYSIFRINNQSETKLNSSDGFLTKNSCLSKQFSQCWEIKDKPDFLNYRILLIKALPNCGLVIEVKNRDIVTWFLQFINDEYKRSDEDLGNTLNIRNMNSHSEIVEEIVDDEIIENDSEMIKKKNPRRNERSKGPQATQRTLAAFVSIFAKMQNPKQIYQEPILSALYFELLSHKNFEIQKMALDCIMAYKHKYLMPYKDNLYNIIDEKKFKDEITGFKIDKDNKIIIEEHREKFIPFLMKILFSKMIVKSKDSSQNRKAMVFRFLGSCTKEEIFTFVKMAFEMFFSFIGDDLIEMINTIKENFNLENVLNPRKLQSSVNLIDLIREQFGGLMGDSLSKYLLNILIGIAATAQEVISRSNEVTPYNLTAFKNIRNCCFVTLTNFFAHLDVYPWIENEIEAIFKVLVWPQIEKLSADCIHRPTPLLKLLLEWSLNPRYHIFFVTHHPTNKNLSPLPYFMELLLGKNASSSVSSTAMEIVENLFKLEFQPNLKDEMSAKEILITNKIEIDLDRLQHITCIDKLNYGSRIMLPYVSDIIKKLQRKLKTHKVKYLSKKELIILSHITELITDTETCDQLLHLLLPILVQNTNYSTGEDIIFQMLTTLTNLLKKTQNPEQYIRNIAPLFQQIQSVGPRKMLIGLLENISKTAGDREDLNLLVEIVTNLNAWDRKSLDQPNYELRLDTMKQIGELTKSGKIDINLCLLIVYHCFHFIKYDKDLAIRDSASFHLKNIIPAVINKYKDQPEELEFFIGKVILNLIRKTFHDKNDNVRIEGILLLGVMARECPESYPILTDLHSLTNNENRELDFFDNITHLQVHRQSQALLKFCEIAKTFKESPNPRTLTQFILPLTSQYLLTEKYISNNLAINAAIDTVGIVCRFLPWFQYESVLQYYLRKLRLKVEYQKQLVRLVMAVLDSFHFDLSNAHVKPDELPSLEEIEKTNAEAKLKKELLKIKLGAEEGDEGKDNEGEEEEEEDSLEKNISKAKEDEEDDNDDSDEIPKKKAKLTNAWSTPVLLSTKSAKRLIQTISRGILPTLNSAIIKLTTHDTSHKVNRKRNTEREEEEILRVPIALAIVKLLQKLPDAMLDHNLPGIFLKITTFLKSQLKSVRMLARDILRRIMVSVGTSRLSILLHHLTFLLTKGFQVHVLVVTIHNILDALKADFKPGDIDKNLKNILNVCLDDIFGKTGEEKEVDKLGMKSPEARSSNKSFMILNIVALNITESCLLDLLIPFKNHLCNSQSKKTVTKVQESFQKIIAGLVENTNLTTETLMIFIYGTTSDSIPDLLSKNKKKLTENEKEKIKRAKPDCFLIQEAPRYRSNVLKNTVKTNSQANAYVLIEFGLQLLHILMKRGKVSDDKYTGYLNPLIPMITISLKSNYVRVTTYSLKCLTAIWNTKTNIPILEENISEIVDDLFKILHKYATTEISKHNENYQLISNGFKAMMSLMRYVQYYTINSDQLKTLLLYVEQDLHSSEKQNIAFSVLKTIIARKLIVPEIHEIMKKIGEISVLSELTAIREDARTIFLAYLMDYPLGKKVDSYLKFFVKQLNYEVISGRQSAIKMLTIVIQKFPLNVLKQQAGFLFLSIGSRLINDEDSDCRSLIADCLESLISHLDQNGRDELFELILVLLEDKKLTHREMAAQLSIRFINIEKEKFSSRIEAILPILISRLSLMDPNTPGRFVKLFEPEEEEKDKTQILMEPEEQELIENEKQKSIDHQLIQIQNAILKLLEFCPDIFTNKSVSQYIDEIAYQSQKLLGYDHQWVRLNATKILSKILATIDFDLLHEIYMEQKIDKKVPRDFLYLNPRTDVRSLILDHCAQLYVGENDSEIAEQVMKNLFYIANILKDVPFLKIDDKGDIPETNLCWLIHRLRRIIHSEVAKAPNSVVLRTAIFNWIEGLTMLLSTENLIQLTPFILAPLVREMSEEDSTIDKDLRQLALKIGKKIKKKIGIDEYNLQTTRVQRKLNIRRADRKKTIALEKINDPVKAANRKVTTQLKKKETKKRKMEIIKGKALPKKKIRKKEFDDGNFF